MGKMTREVRDQRMERLKHCPKSAKAEQSLDRSYSLLDGKIKGKQLSEARRMIPSISVARLLKALFTDEKMFMSESLPNRQNRRQLFNKGQQKSAITKTIVPQSFSAFYYGLGGNLLQRNDCDYSSSIETPKSAFPLLSSRFHEAYCGLRVLSTLAPTALRFGETKLLRIRLSQRLSSVKSSFQASGARMFSR
ncbi:hypothetical protein KIN20_029978 [Parelaphostrongylus tenuis]|uniref:Uncharacterized protein n=1 Tax=Parelaphostrongylus tenuis TaxID=148309 RepID=A0AAD5WFU0_PARTN|nr:hypothetical protein KIN20_029978 [Parelaphostrongylus tenuis]